MSQPGWYPDPGGSGQFRFWDGARWSPTTSPTPGGPSGPTPGQGPGGQNNGGRSRVGLVLLLIVALVVAGGIGLAVWHPWNRVTDITDNPPIPTVTGGGDGPITPTPSNNSHAPAPSNSPHPSETTSIVPPATCRAGDPGDRSSTNDGTTLRGGGLTMTQVTAAGWSAPGIGGTPFGHDVTAQTVAVTDQWYDIVSIGALDKADGYTGLEQAAKLVFACSATASWYDNPVITVQSAGVVTVGGHQAYEVVGQEEQVVAGHPDIKGDAIDVLVVDVGNSDRFGVFFGTWTIGDAALEQAVRSARTSVGVG